MAHCEGGIGARDGNVSTYILIIGRGILVPIGNTIIAGPEVLAAKA